MNHQHAEAFPPEVIERLRTYVYRLIDPRNGETFDVGKRVPDEFRKPGAANPIKYASPSKEGLAAPTGLSKPPPTLQARQAPPADLPGGVTSA